MTHLVCLTTRVTWYLSPSFQRRRVKAGCGVWDHITLDRTDHGWMSTLAPASLRTTFTMSVFP